jgi:hypothetical protein
MNDPIRSPSAGTKAHGDLIAAIADSLGSQPDVFMLRINVFAGRRSGSETWSRSAPKGTPDLLCCVRNRRTGLGLFLAMDAKTGAASLTKEQRNFRDAIQRFGGGMFAEVRSVDDAAAAVEGARNA